MWRTKSRFTKCYWANHWWTLPWPEGTARAGGWHPATESLVWSPAAAVMDPGESCTSANRKLPHPVVTPDGMIETVAGGMAGFSGDGDRQGMRGS